MCRERGRSVSCNDMSFAEVNLFLGEHFDSKHGRFEACADVQCKCTSIYLGEFTISMQAALLKVRIFALKNGTVNTLHFQQHCLHPHGAIL